MALSKSIAERGLRAAVPARTEQAGVERGLGQLSRAMEGVFRIPGTGWRIGLDAIVGLIPGVGDFATTAVSLYILAAGVRYRVPKVTLLRMGANIAVDYLLGRTPVGGDIFDAAWKTTQMTVELLRRRAAVRAEEASRGRTSDWLFLAAIVLVLLVLFFATLALSLWLLLLVAA